MNCLNLAAQDINEETLNTTYLYQNQERTTVSEVSVIARQFYGMSYRKMYEQHAP